MPKATNKPYRTSGWIAPFSFSDNNRRVLRARVGLSVECISKIEMGIEDERGIAEIVSDEPSTAQVEATLYDGADAAANLLRWLIQVDDKTQSVIELSNWRRTGKLLSDYKPVIKELSNSIELAKRNLPEKKRGRPPATFSLRLANIIADAIERDGQHLDATPNGPLCQTLGIALSAIGRQRSKTSDIVSKMLKERGN
jgi:hypothetical protein